MPDGGLADARIDARARTISVAELAWIALLPCVAIAVLAVVVLGPPVGDLLFTHTTDSLWPPGWWETTGRPEPAKHGRFIVAALVPLLLVAAILLGARRRPALAPLVARALSLAGFALVLATVAFSLLEQHPTFTPAEEPIQEPETPIFGLTRVLVAIALVAGAMLLLHRRALAARIERLTRETRPRRLAGLAFATAFAAAWILTAVTTDRLGLGVLALNLPWTMNDAVAVFEGRTPLVDYHPIYAKLLPYASAPVFAAFGTSAFVYSTFMALLSLLALMAVYATFRRVTRRTAFACALFVPFLATSDIRVPIDTGPDAGLDTSPMTLAALWPMRYGGAYLLAWLTVRHLDGSWPRRPWILFAVGGVIAVDNTEFGVAAMTASAAALLCADPPASARAVRTFAVDVIGGVLAALAVVAAITLVRTGRPPDFALLFEYARIFTTLGWFSMPLLTWDLHIAVYATFVAAMAVAAVRLARREHDRLLTAMLAWSGLFGVLVGGYFVARPDVMKLTGVLSAWSFALSMLTIVSVRSLAARGWRPLAPQLLVLFGFALSLCSLSLLTPPNEHVARLTRSIPQPGYLPAAEQFIGERSRRGETVAILVPMSYVISHELGLRNVAPYGFMNAVVTRSQMTRLLRTLYDQRVRVVFVPEPGSSLLNEGDSAPEQLRALESIGFRRGATGTGIVELRRA